MLGAEKETTGKVKPMSVFLGTVKVIKLPAELRQDLLWMGLRDSQ
jgi:hypothetical protein